ncbi:hypothetical protein [Povalibacter sp.]|uniref:hypothetical protein n=1 Tax=Povalibacter sp. TaxID=1962978 RepID=UPI002F4289D0
MPEHSLDGIQITQTPQAEQKIARDRAQLTAFVGRTLRGPLNTPLIVRSFADFQRIFGGLWQPSPLSYAVEHFFEQGGRQAVIVRIANQAAPATVSLRCERESLVLEALAPGTREFLRASVDYDNIESTDPLRFNLVVQRVRAPGSERIEEQEIFRNVSIDPLADRYVATSLLESGLVRVRGSVPGTRPSATFMPGTNLPVGYVSSNPDGDDGRPLTDYDIIGSAARRTGLFALAALDDLAFVYVPPLSRSTEVGASTLLVAAQFCREHHALLIVDPPVGWETPAAALQGLKDLDFYSDSAVMFFPRLACMDRLRGRAEVFGNGGAVAGMLSRADDVTALVPIAPEAEPLLRAGARFVRDVSPADRRRLAQAGINVLLTVRGTDRIRAPLRTLANGASASSDGSYLTPRRFVQSVIRAIEHGTRWAVVRPHDPSTQQRVTQQVAEFLTELRDAGAFRSAVPDTAFLVICDERINDPLDDPGALHLLVQFAALHTGDYHSHMITHTAKGSTVRPVVINRLEASLRLADDLEREITIRVDQENDFIRVLAG